MENNQIFLPPRHIEINKFTYSYKDQLINKYYSYRCKFRKNCKYTIKVNQSELEK